MTAFASTVPLWTATNAVVVGTRRQPTAADGRVFVATSIGTTGGSEPVWPTNEPWTVTDGTTAWIKGTSLRRQAVSGIYNSLLAFKAANSWAINDVAQVRPQAIASLAMPAVYIGDRDEVISAVGQIQQRVINGFQLVLVDISPSNAQAAARADDIVDALDDWFSTRYHTASGFSILRMASVAGVSESDGSTTYPAQLMTFEVSAGEGRS